MNQEQKLRRLKQAMGQINGAINFLADFVDEEDFAELNVNQFGLRKIGNKVKEKIEQDG